MHNICIFKIMLVKTLKNPTYFYTCDIIIIIIIREYVHRVQNHLMYILLDDDRTGVETCRSLQCFNVV
jgi:hypothetical protein